MKFKKRKEEITRVDYSETIVDRNFTRFEADLIGGNVIIQEGPMGKASVRVQWKEDEDFSSFGRFWIEGNTIRLKSKSFRSFIGQKDPYIIEVTLPPATCVTIKMMAGVLYLQDLSGDITAHLKAGEIIGNLSGKYVAATVWAGDIQLVFDDITSASHINIKCMLGDVELQFPQGVIVDLNSYDEEIHTTVGAHVRVKTFCGGYHIEEYQ